ncbi:MAG: RnfH family protein [Chitinophagaceae bacterium]|nr:RnfH family protein [Rubrivivax sp.]
MACADGGPAITVEVVYCPRPGAVDRVALQLAAGTTVADALRLSGMLERHGLAPAGLRLGVWGRLCEPGSALRDHDRVELYRPLSLDPKEARRLRHQRQRDNRANRDKKPAKVGRRA